MVVSGRFISGMSLMLGLISGCAIESGSATPPPATGAEPEAASLATLAASDETTAALHVARWVTYEDSEGRFVSARDAGDAELARLQVRATPAGVELTGVLSSEGRAVVSSQGEITGEPGRVRELAAALAADAKANGPFQGGATGGPRPDATHVTGWGTFDIFWSLAQPSGRTLVGNLCPGTPRDTAKASLLTGSGSCNQDGWFTADQYDCRFWVSWQEPFANFGTCYWQYTTTTCSHPVCDTGPPLVSGCGDCAKEVCVRDNYCCSVAWDALCVSEASSCHSGACR